jgi:hypothetical protein
VVTRTGADTRRAVGVLLFVVVSTASGLAQGAANPGRAPTPGSEEGGLRCWWTTDRTAVHVGEHFHLALTCRVLDTGAERIALDERPLEPAAVSLAPFEVIEGVRASDIRQGRWRFLQYRYTLRIMAEDAFGRDVAIPGLELRYRTERALGGSEQMGGRDLTYDMPAYPIRIESLAPAGAHDIADAADESFRGLQARRFRADIAFVAAALVLVVPPLLTASVLLRRRRRGRAEVRQSRPLAPAAILRGVDLELAGIQEARAAGGWSEPLIGRALASLRIAAAVAVGRPVAELPLKGDQPAREGEIEIRPWILRPGRVTIASNLTVEALAQLLGGGRAAAAHGREWLAGSFQQAFATLNRARYVAAVSPGDDDLDEALAASRDAVRRLRRLHSWPGRTARDVAALGRTWRRRWTRL